MKALKVGYDRTIMACALIGFIIIAMVDTALIRIEYQSYDEKINIISAMIEREAQGEDNIHIATCLLKGTRVTVNGEGKEILKQLGYLSGQGNEPLREFRKQMAITVSASLVLYILFLIGVAVILRNQKRKRQQVYHTLEEQLSYLRSGIFENPPSECGNHIERESARLYSEMKSLGEYLKLMEEQVNREKEGTKALVSDISHQLKTPVAALKTSFEVLLKENLDPVERKEFSDRCSQQLKGIENLLSALINISRMETGMIAIQEEEACIFDTLLESVNRVYSKAEEKHINIEMESEERLQQLKLPHDRKWLCEAFINILENAVKYSPSHSRIMIRMLERITFLRIEIEDQGIGIPKEEYAQVFKRFYRGKEKEVRMLPGSGIGLYLSREIIERHNGTISVASGCSKPNPGSVFTIQLPYKV